jgi:hypothetical protein
MKNCCEQMSKNIEIKTLEFNSKYREWGINISDGGSSKMLIEYCPWCGKMLPVSVRDNWFDILEDMDIDVYGDDIPAEFKSDKWWIERKL